MRSSSESFSTKLQKSHLFQYKTNRSFLPCRGTNFFSSRARKICHPWLPRLLGLLLMLVLTYKFLYRFQNPGQGASTFWTTIGNEWKMSYLCSVKNDQTPHQKWQDIDKQKWIQTLLLLSISVEKDRIRPFVLLLISSQFVLIYALFVDIHAQNTLVSTLFALNICFVQKNDVSFNRKP